MKKANLSVLALALCFLLCACAIPGTGAPEDEDNAASSSTGALPPEHEADSPNVDNPEADTVEQLLSTMTVEEKVGQLFFVRCPKENAAEDVAQYHLGSVLLFGRDFKNKTADEVRTNIAALQAAADIPLLIGADEEGGSVVRASGNKALRSEAFPAPMDVYSTGGTDALRQDALEKSAFLLDLGVNVNFAPVADVAHSKDSFIYPRTLALDAEGTAAGVSAIVQAMNDAGIGSVAKHFPGYGDNEDTHTGIAVDERPYETFASDDFLPFCAAAEAGCGSILVSHNIVLCMDEDLPASLSPRVHKLLREKIGFDGVILTDDLAMDALEGYTAGGAVAVLALQAGNDMLVTTDYETQIPAVLAAVARGEISESTLNGAVERVLQWKLSLGLLTEARND